MARPRDIRIYSRLMIRMKKRLAFLFILSAACGLFRPVEDAGPVPTRAPIRLPPPSTGSWWKPGIDTTWQWQLSGEIDTKFNVDMYDIDLFESDAETVQALKAAGRIVICYISAGSREDWRPDAAAFPPEIIGRDYQGWPGENWLDIRRIDLIAPIMQARLDACAAKGFDGVEPDNIDAYTNNTGFPLTYSDQLVYNTWLAQEAHARGLSIGLKNDAEQASDLLAYYDWALLEECFEGDWCEEMLPFIRAGKPVFAAEYVESGARLSEICPQAKSLGFSVILKRIDLDPFRESCPEE